MRFICRINKAKYRHTLLIFNTYSFFTEKRLRALHNVTMHVHCLYFFLSLKALSQNYEKQQLALSCMSFLPSLRLEQLGSNWADFNEIWYLIFFLNLSTQFKFHYSLIRRVLCTKTNIYFDHISIDSS